MKMRSGVVATIYEHIFEDIEYASMWKKIYITSFFLFCVGILIVLNIIDMQTYFSILYREPGDVWGTIFSVCGCLMLAWALRILIAYIHMYIWTMYIGSIKISLIHILCTVSMHGILFCLVLKPGMMFGIHTIMYMMRLLFIPNLQLVPS